MPFNMYPSTSLTRLAIQTSLTVLICGPFYLPYTKSKELRRARATTGGKEDPQFMCRFRSQRADLSLIMGAGNSYQQDV